MRNNKIPQFTWNIDLVLIDPVLRATDYNRNRPETLFIRPGSISDITVKLYPTLRMTLPKKYEVTVILVSSEIFRRKSVPPRKSEIFLGSLYRPKYS